MRLYELLKVINHETEIFLWDTQFNNLGKYDVTEEIDETHYGKEVIEVSPISDSAISVIVRW